MKNQEIKMVIKGYLKDESEVIKKAEPCLAVHPFLPEFLPQNPQIQQWVRQLYVEDKNGNKLYGLKDVMNSIFSYYATRINGKRAYLGANLFINYAYNNVLLEKNQANEYDEWELPYFWQHIDYLIEKIECYREKVVDHIKRETVQIDLKNFQYLKEKGKMIDEEGLKIIYLFIKKYWSLLKNDTYMYRLLACMSKLQNWEENPNTRIKLMHVLNAVDVIVNEY